MAGKIYGVDTEKEKMLQQDLSRDLTPVPVKVLRWFSSSASMMIPLLSIFIILIYPGTIFMIALLNYPLFRYHKKRIVGLPYRKPKSCFELDPNQLDPVTNKPSKAEGISFYGNDIKTGEQIWFNDSDVRTHTLIFGTTGSGKTETLVSLCVNSLIHSSGFIYVDGKGDNGLFLKIFSLVRRFGREDDLLLINYMTGSVDTNKKTTEKLSNTMNPFANGSADALTELIVSLLPDGGGGNDMWKGRAAIFMAALMRVLVALRDSRKILLDVETIRSYFELPKLEALIKREDIDEVFKAGLKDYVFNLPGYKKPTPQQPVVEQEFDVLQQHGFITMQYTEVFGLLADSFGHIMKTQLAECDFYDVVVNRRILVVLLPALEKSQQNLSNLGKIIVASVRAMMSSALGSQVEGSKKDVIDRKPTNGSAPYLTIFDEYGYYAVKGAAVMPAQARSLGFAMVFAGQDYQAFKKASPEEAASIVANCTIKICMKLEDPSETFDIFAKAAGEGKIAVGSGFQLDKDATFQNYMDQGNVTFEKSSRINVRDLKAQPSGAAHILFGDGLVRAKMFYAAPTSVKNLRLNAFLKVKPLSYKEVQMYKGGFNKIKKFYDKIVKNPEEYKNSLKQLLGNSGFVNELDVVFKAFKVLKNSDYNTQAFFAIASYIEKVEFIDNKIIYDLDGGEKPVIPQGEKTIKRQEKIIEKEQEINALKSNVITDTEVRAKTTREKIKGDASENSYNRGKGESIIDKYRNIVQKKQRMFEQLTNDSYNPYKQMEGFDVKNVQKSIENIEYNLNKKLNEVGELPDQEMLKPEYSKVIGEQTIVSIGLASAYPLDTKIKNRDNKKLIDTILDGIMVDEIKES